MTTLTQKIVAASLAVGQLKPDKRNNSAGAGYDYISADKILERAGEALAAQGVAVFPSITAQGIERVEYVNNAGKASSRYDADVVFEMHVTDGETEMVLTWVGRGNDYTAPDKAFYKATTSGHKYFLMKLLNVGVGNEDGEYDAAPPGSETMPAVTQKPAPPVKLTQQVQPQSLSNEAFVDMVAGMRQAHVDSDGVASEAQYRFLVGTIEKLTGVKHSGSDVLTYIVGRDVTEGNPPGKKLASHLLDALSKTKKDKDTGAWVENPKYRPDVEQAIKRAFEIADSEEAV